MHSNVRTEEIKYFSFPFSSEQHNTPHLPIFTPHTSECFSYSRDMASASQSLLDTLTLYLPIHPFYHSFPWHEAFVSLLGRIPTLVHTTWRHRGLICCQGTCTLYVLLLVNALVQWTSTVMRHKIRFIDQSLCRKHYANEVQSSYKMFFRDSGFWFGDGREERLYLVSCTHNTVMLASVVFRSFSMLLFGGRRDRYVLLSKTCTIFGPI